VRLNLIAVAGCTLCLALSVIGTAARADTIPVQNASFEISNAMPDPCLGTGCSFNYGPIPDWTVTGTGGSWQPSSSYFNLSTIDGSKVAFSSGGSISQILGVGLTPNSSYTLSVGIGNRLDLLVANFTIGLFAGTTPLEVLSGTNGSITPGTFADESFTFVTGVTVAPGNLMIDLTSSTNQTDFDNVTLTENAISTPEASSLLLLAAGLAGLGMLALSFKSKQAGSVTA